MTLTKCVCNLPCGISVPHSASQSSSPPVPPLLQTPTIGARCEGVPYGSAVRDLGASQLMGSPAPPKLLRRDSSMACSDRGKRKGGPHI